MVLGVLIFKIKVEIVLTLLRMVCFLNLLSVSFFFFLLGLYSMRFVDGFCWWGDVFLMAEMGIDGFWFWF